MGVPTAWKKGLLFTWWTALFDQALPVVSFLP